MYRVFFLSFYFLLCLSAPGVCQSDTLYFYYDSAWNEIADSARTDYKRRAINNENGFWEVTDYYKSGQVQMTGTFMDRAMKKKLGSFEWFYPSGKLERQAMFAGGRPRGEELLYYENGQIDTYLKYDNDGRMSEEKYYRQDGSESVVKNPEFPGGLPAMYAYLSQKVKYPRSLRKHGIDGKVYITFTVHTDGTLQDIHIIYSPDEAMSKEAIRAVSSMPKWKPGSRDGKLLRIKYNLPITFAMD